MHASLPPGSYPFVCIADRRLRRLLANALCLTRELTGVCCYFEQPKWHRQQVYGVSCARATAYVCQDFTCKAPTADLRQLRQMLEESRTYGGASWGVAVEEVPLSSLSRGSKGTAS